MANVWGSSGADLIHVRGDGNAVPAGFRDMPGATSGADCLYGNSGNDIIAAGGGRDQLSGGRGDDRLIGGQDGDRLDGGCGIDTADYSTSDGRVFIDHAGVGHGGDAEGDTLSSIESIRGSRFGDYLSGNAGANTLTGGQGDDGLVGREGADILDGGAGVDMADYIASKAAVTVDLGAGTASGGDAAGDTLTSIESLRGSAFDDSLTGDGGANRLSGMGGTDTLNGGAGNDILIGDGGADILIGGEGIDIALYDNAATSVTVNLGNTAVNTGDAAGDSYSGIENVTGSAFADGLTGDDRSNSLFGWAGDDTLDGGGGRDVMTGGNGADTFAFSAAGDSTIAALDRINDFSRGQGDTIDLSAITHGAGSFIGTEAYNGVAGEVRYTVSNGITVIGGDIDGDRVSDFRIELYGTHHLAAGDFVL